MTMEIVAASYKQRGTERTGVLPGMEVFKKNKEKLQMRLTDQDAHLPILMRLC